MTYSSLIKRFAAAGAALAVTGCATVCGTRECRLEESARTMLQSTDFGIKAAGAKTLINIHPEIAGNSAEIRDALVPKTIECTLGAPKIVNGIKIIPCVKSPSGPQ